MIKEIKGIVIHGKEHGRTIGFPTANIELEKGIIKDGTYKVNIVIDEKIYHGVGSASNNTGLFETYIFDFDKFIYGKEIEIIILEKIRDNIKFDNLKELKKQIEKDVLYAKRIKKYVLTFGTFDLVHEGHKYFLKKAKRYGDILVTILATDKSIEKFKNIEPTFSPQERLEQVKELGVSDIIGIGDESNPLKWIDLYDPSVICLGYDQLGFSKELDEHINKNNLNIDIIRIDGHKIDEQKSSILRQQLTP